MDFDAIFKYGYPPLCAVLSGALACGIAVLIQNRQFRREDMIRKRESDAEEISRLPNPIELDILRHCLKDLPEDGHYHFAGGTQMAQINDRQVKNYLGIAIEENLCSLQDKKYIDIFVDNSCGLSFTMLIDPERLEEVVGESEDRP